MQPQEAEYFDGLSARSKKVFISRYDDIIQVIDINTNAILRNIFLKDCSVSTLNNILFLYLNQSKNSYLIIPPESIWYNSIRQQDFMYKKNWFGKLMNMKGAPLLGLLIGLLVGIYLIFISVVPWIGLKVISIPKEISLGKKIYSNYISDVTEDTTATAFAQKFADNISLSSTFPIKITVIKDSVVNAFAMPGGNIIVYSGIIKKMNSYQEFAALLGHESTHINQRHGMKSLLRSVSGSILFSMILNDMGNVSGVLLQNAEQLRTLSFSRDLEQQADEKGMEIMLKNNIDPVGMKLLMVDLEKANHDIPEAYSFISTHPLTKARIKNADKFLARYDNATNRSQPVLKSIWDELKNQ